MCAAQHEIECNAMQTVFKLVTPCSLDSRGLKERPCEVAQDFSIFQEFFSIIFLKYILCSRHARLGARHS